MRVPSAPAEVWTAFRRGWKELLAIHLTVALVSAAAVGPVVAIGIHAAVSLSGGSALSDAAIADFVSGPLGAVVALMIASVWVTVQLLGYTALLVPARALLAGRAATVLSVPRVMLPALGRVLRLSFRFVLRLLLWSAPFLFLHGAVYARLLRTHDINYYLAEKPPAFWWATGLAAAIALGHTVTVARLATSWVHALPLVLFRRASAGAALRLSGRAAVGQRKWILGGLVAWAVGTPLLAAVLNSPWSAIAIWAAGRFSHHPAALVAALGLAVALSLVTGWLVGFLGEALLALHHLRLYRLAGLDRETAHEDAPGRLPRVGTKPFLAGGLLLCAVTMFLCHRWIESLHTEHPTVIIAHRGASAVAPENTLAAVQAAVEAKADWIEIDVQESADGSVHVFHDRDFKRFGGPGRPIWELRDAEIAAIDIGSWKAPGFAGERTPLLADVLAVCRGKARVLIELKYYGHAQRLEERVIEIVEAAGMADQVMIMSLNHAGVRRIRQLRPQWKVGLLSTVALGDVTRLDVDFLGLNARTTTRRLIRSAARRGMKVHVWTVNDPLGMTAQLGRGVDGLITDDPALARAVIIERSEAPFAKKLLLNLAGVLGKEPPAVSQ